jgi:hypothetical protein
MIWITVWQHNWDNPKIHLVYSLRPSLIAYNCVTQRPRGTLISLCDASTNEPAN